MMIPEYLIMICVKLGTMLSMKKNAYIRKKGSQAKKKLPLEASLAQQEVVLLAQKGADMIETVPLE